MSEHKHLNAMIAEKARVDAAFRAHLKADPRAAIREAFDGRELPAGAHVNVVEQTADELYIVLPKAPTDGTLSEEQLDMVSGGLCWCIARAPQEARPS